MEIVLHVPEKILEGFLPYTCMGMVAILVMWPRCRKQIFVPPTYGGSAQNLALIGQAVSDKKTFKIMDGWMTDGRRTSP